MRVEVVAIGTELLLGQINDTNSSWIGEQLALAGIDTFFQTKVGDNQARIVEVLRLALSRSDAVICCGGLGPTQDDLTRHAIAEVMGAELVRDDAIVERITEMFAARGRHMPTNNLQQADVPLGARTIPQQPGTAPGLICPIGETGKVIYAVPGVPYEMKEMVSGTILADLQERAGTRSAIVSRVLRTWGQSESGLAEMLAGRIDEIDQLVAQGAAAPTIAFLASGIEGIKVRITAKAASEADALRALDDEERLLRSLLAELVFGLDDETMESVVLDLCRAGDLTLAVAESVTGGMVASRLATLPAAAGRFRGGIVLGDRAAAREVLGVEETAISELVAGEIARSVRTLLRADVGVATWGAADDPDVAPGTVCLAVAIGDDLVATTVRLPGDRSRVSQFAAISAADLARRQLLARAAASSAS